MRRQRRPTQQSGSNPKPRSIGLRQRSSSRASPRAAAPYAATGEEFKTAIDRLTAKIGQLAEHPIDAAPGAAYAAIGEQLETAIDRLTAKIEQLSERPIDAAPAAACAAIGEQLENAIHRL